MEAYVPWIWLGVAVFFAIVEAHTWGLVSIWFAAGALMAMLAAMAEVTFFWQMLIFAVGSLVALVVTRPLVRRFVSSRTVPTNADRLLDQRAKVTERIDPRNASGAVYADGKTWSARSLSEEPIPAGMEVRIVRIEGVKLLVEPVKSEERTEGNEREEENV